MKKIAFAVLLATQVFVNASFADETKKAEQNATPTKLPMQEKAFVAAINNFDKKSIVAQLGEPAKADDIKLKKTGKVIASIWQYHSINIAEDGTTYLTTELDFIDDKVVQVVFFNNDGIDRTPDTEQTYELPLGAPQQTMPEQVQPEEQLPEIN